MNKDIENININQIVNGKRKGLWIYYLSSGNIDRKVYFKNGKFYGLYEFYWSNGDLYYKRFYL